MKVLYNTQTQEVSLYPRNDDHPVVGLDSAFIVLDKVTTTPPEYDPQTQYLVEAWEVNLPDSQYVQIWSLESKPDWEGFMGPFYTPAGAGNGSPHDILETKVQKCFLVASRITDQTERETAQAAALSLQRHWSNCVIGLTSKEIRSSNGWLWQNWNALKGFFTAAASLLPIDQQEVCNLTLEETTFIESLFAQYNLL